MGCGIRLLIVAHPLEKERSVSYLLSQINCSQATLSQRRGKLLDLDIAEARYYGGRGQYSCKSREAKEVVRVLDRLASDEMVPSGT